MLPMTSFIPISVETPPVFQPIFTSIDFVTLLPSAAHISLLSCLPVTDSLCLRRTCKSIYSITSVGLQLKKIASFCKEDKEGIVTKFLPFETETAHSLIYREDFYKTKRERRHNFFSAINEVLEIVFNVQRNDGSRTFCYDLSSYRKELLFSFLQLCNEIPIEWLVANLHKDWNYPEQICGVLLAYKFYIILESKTSFDSKRCAILESLIRTYAYYDGYNKYGFLKYLPNFFEGLGEEFAKICKAKHVSQIFMKTIERNCEFTVWISSVNIDAHGAFQLGIGETRHLRKFHRQFFSRFNFEAEVSKDKLYEVFKHFWLCYCNRSKESRLILYKVCKNISSINVFSIALNSLRMTEFEDEENRKIKQNIMFKLYANRGEYDHSNPNKKRSNLTKLSRGQIKLTFTRHLQSLQEFRNILISKTCSSICQIILDYYPFVSDYNTLRRPKSWFQTRIQDLLQDLNKSLT